MTIVIIIIALLGLLLLAAALMDKTLRIEKSIVINKPVAGVFNFARLLRNHDQFSVWNQMDPDMKREIRGVDGTVGSVYAWDSAKKKNVGAGEQEIKKIEDNKYLEYELRFTRPMEDTAGASFTFDGTANGFTKVQWGFYGQVKFPMNIMKSAFEKGLGKSLEQGLVNLKTVLEKN